MWVAPPCTTFSIANFAFPRSYEVPRGFDPCERRTWIGNRLADLSLLFLRVCAGVGCAGVDENPGTSKMRRLPGWRKLECFDPLFRLALVASCAFGAPYQKIFAFLHVNINLEPVNKKRLGFQGSLTKKTGSYWSGLVSALARCFVAHLRERAAQEAQETWRIGHERPLLDILADSLPGETERAWRWRRPATSTSWSSAPCGLSASSGFAAAMPGEPPWALTPG